MEQQPQKIKVDYKQLIRTEYAKCAKDPAYFIRKYCYIQSQRLGRIPFDLYQYQEDAIRTVLEKESTIFLKGRQIGISTTIACFCLWYMLFNKDKNILVIATRQDTAQNMIDKVKYAFDGLPIWLQVERVKNNMLSVKFKNNSEIQAISSNTEGARSESASFVILDEAAFIPNIEKIWQASRATLSESGGKAILISTPNGAQGFFYNKYKEAEEAKNQNKPGAMFPVKLDWRVHPGRTEEWKQAELATMSKRQFSEEHEAEFLASGNTVFDADTIEFQMKNNVDLNPAIHMGPGGDLWIWEQPDYSKTYIVVADVSRGEQSDEGDYSALHVLDIKNCVQVAEYKGRIDTTSFGNALINTATLYNDALLVVENGGIGWATIQTILNRGYKNLFYMTEDMKYIDNDEIDINKFIKKENNSIAGFTMSHRTRPLIISKLDQYLRDHAITIKSQRTINEMLSFIWHNGKPQAAEGQHDDLIMSLAIGLWVRDTALKLHQLGIEHTKMALDKMMRSGQWDGVYTSMHPIQDPYKMPIPGGGSHDFRWVL